MKKLLFLLPLLLLVSCFSEEKEKPKTIAVNYNDVALVCSQTVWDSNFGDTLRNAFSEHVVGLPKLEPRFTWAHYLDLQTDKNVLNSRNQIEVRLNQFCSYRQLANTAKNQTRFVITGRNYEQIDSVFKKEIFNIKNTIQKQEITFHNNQGKTNTKICKNLYSKFKLLAKVPKAYYVVQESKGFYWLRKDERSGNNNLLIYFAPYEQIRNKKPIITNILDFRNKITKIYVQGKHNDSYMITEQSFYPDFNKTLISNQLAFEIRGLWEFENDFMQGPYINYAIPDIKNKRFIFIDGFVFTPNKTKRQNIFELEAIIKSIIKL